MIKHKEPDDEFTIEGKTTTSFQDTFIYNHNEFFKDEDNIPQKSISAKLITLPKKSGYDWEILENKKVVLVLKGIRFNNDEKKFLMSVDGMKFLIEGYKQGWSSVSKFKEEIKKIK